MSNFDLKKPTKKHYKDVEDAQIVEHPESKIELKEDERGQYLELPDNAEIVVGDDRAKRSLAPTDDGGRYDPFDKYKTDPNCYYYAINANNKLLREERKREGFELIPDAVCGDLVLGKMSIERHNEMMKKEQVKAKAQMRAPKENYRKQMEEMGAKDLIVDD